MSKDDVHHHVFGARRRLLTAMMNLRRPRWSGDLMHIFSHRLPLHNLYSHADQHSETSSVLRQRFEVITKSVGVSYPPDPSLMDEVFRRLVTDKFDS